MAPPPQQQPTTPHSHDANPKCSPGCDDNLGPYHLLSRTPCASPSVCNKTSIIAPSHAKSEPHGRKRQRNARTNKLT
eukprot:12184695-Alexandrium_andersonii.AAC.1